MEIATFYKAVVAVPCGACGEQLTASIGLPNYDASSSDPFTEEEQVTCSHCGGAETIAVDHAGAELTVRNASHPLLKGSGAVTDTVYDFELLDQLEPPPLDPYEIYEDSVKDVVRLRDTVAAAKINSETFQRMIFIQHFSAIEAYLSDTLQRLVYDDEEVLKNMVKSVSELKNDTMTLADAMDPDAVRLRVLKYLSTISYHRFTKVDSLYKYAIGLTVLPEQIAHREILFEALNLRHDCVHRNGFSHEGELHGDLKEQVRRVDLLFSRMAEKVEDAVRAWYRRKQLPSMDPNIPF